MNTKVPKRVRFALPFAMLTGPDMVRLVAGEELRYTLRSPALDKWLPGFLKNFDQEVEWRLLLDKLPGEHHQQAAEILDRLYGERALLEADNGDLPLPPRLSWIVEGSGKLYARLQAAMPLGTSDAVQLTVLCQDSLDYAAALDFNRRNRDSGAARWLWVSCGPISRGFVSPVFRLGGGPCLACLLRNFKRLSPAPEIYEHLIEHSNAGGTIPPAPFSDAAVDLLAALARWKMEACSQPEPCAGVYRLHVVEVQTLECMTHRVFRDPHCPDCSPR